MRVRNNFLRSLGVFVMGLTTFACDEPAGPNVDSTVTGPLSSVTKVQFSEFLAAPAALNGAPWVGTVPGFTSPLDGVASPDGSVFYFTAFTDEAVPKAAVYSVPSIGGQGTLLHAGGPLGYPSGLLMSCDGRQLYVADRAVAEDEDAPLGSDPGGVYELAVVGGAVVPMTNEEVVRPSGLAMGNDCSSLFVTARGFTGKEPGLFIVDGGTTTEIHTGEPLRAPGGVHVDSDNIAWVMDQDPDQGSATLFSITALGEIEPVVSNLMAGVPSGVSLDPTGMVAVIPTAGPGRGFGLRTINLTTGSQAFFPTPQVMSPGGIRTARTGEVMILVDNGGGGIYRIE